MKVLLIFPPKGFTSKEPLPSLGLISLAAYLKKEGIQVEVIDASVNRLSWRSLKREIKKAQAQIIGITCLTEFRFESFAASRAAKKVSPESWVVIGGPHPTFCDRDTLLYNPAVDMVVRGEGENILLDLCRAYENKLKIEDISGITYRKGGKIRQNPDASLIQDLDNLPFPARELVPIEKYNFRLFVPGEGWRQTTHLITSRGCPFGCSFCITSQMSGRLWRARSPESIIAELEEIIRNTGIRTIWFYDDTFTMSKERVLKICDLIVKKNLNIKFTCSIRADTVDKGLLTAMKEAGCFKIFFGVESGSQRILDEVCGKKITLEQVRCLSRWLDELGIVKNPSYIIGFPSETMKEAQMTLDLMREIGGQVSLSFLRIYPGTRIEKIAKEKNILTDNFSWSNLKSQKSISVGAAHGQAPLFIDTLSWTELSQLAVDWAVESKISIWKRIPEAIKGVRSFSDLKHLFIAGKSYFKRKIGRGRR